MSAIETEVKQQQRNQPSWLPERTGNGARKGNGLIIDPSVVVEQEGFNTRTAGMGELYYSMPHVVEHLNSGRCLHGRPVQRDAYRCSDG